MPPSLQLIAIVLLLWLSVDCTSTNQRGLALDTIGPRLDTVQFANPDGESTAAADVDIVLSNMTFERVQLVGEYQEAYEYLSDEPGVWSTQGGEAPLLGGLHYLFQKLPAGRWAVPPTGMRSSVPLGGLGGGSLELRADGALRDWRMLNNNPASIAPTGMKRSFEHAAFGLWVGGRARGAGKLLRTQLPASPGACSGETVGTGVTILGADLQQLALSSIADCSAACCELKGCAGWLFENRTDATMGDCSAGRPCCYLKSSVAKTAPKALVTAFGSISRAADVPTLLPRVDGFRYRGAFPVSRLDVLDAQLLSSGGPELSASLYGFSRLALHDPNATATPAITFATVLRNPGDTPVRVSLLFTMPDVLQQGARGGGGGGAWSTTNLGGAPSLRLIKAGTTSTSGSFIAQGFASGAEANTTWFAADSLSAVWSAFEQHGGELPNADFSSLSPRPHGGTQGALAMSVNVPPSTNLTVGVVLAWYLPNRDFAGTRVGQFYTTLFPSAEAVAAAALSEMAPSLLDVVAWNRWCMQTDLPRGPSNAKPASRSVQARSLFKNALRSNHATLSLCYAHFQESGL